jgi:hypothetical protein
VSAGLALALTVGTVLLVAMSAFVYDACAPRDPAHVPRYYVVEQGRERWTSLEEPAVRANGNVVRFVDSEGREVTLLGDVRFWPVFGGEQR